MNRFRSYLYTIAGCPLLCLGVGMFALQVWNHPEWPRPYFPSFYLPPSGPVAIAVYNVASIALVTIGGNLITFGQKMRQQSAAAIRRNDLRQPVLLLRPFGVDERKVDGGRIQRTFIALSGFPIQNSFEQELRHLLKTFGPVIAIGKPGENLPPLGAGREYVSNDEWQNRVGELLNESRMVCVIVDISEGLQWELERIRDLGFAHKTVLVYPPGRVGMLDEWLDRLFGWGSLLHDHRRATGKMNILVDMSITPPLVVATKRMNRNDYRAAFAQSKIGQSKDQT